MVGSVESVDIGLKAGLLQVNGIAPGFAGLWDDRCPHVAELRWIKAARVKAARIKAARIKAARSGRGGG